MENEGEHESRLSKGLIGVIALALIGGGGGTLGYSLFGGSPDSAADNSIIAAEETSGSVPAMPSPADKTVNGPDRMPAEAGTITVDPPAPRTRAPQIRPPKPTRPMQASFVVRFEKGGKVDDCLKLYRADKEASRTAFADWASQHPELSGMRLERVNYSGEAILAYDSSEDDDPLSNAKQLQARLQSLKSVRYADPDYTAFPGKGE